MHNKVKVKVLAISISRHTTSGSDLIKVGGGGGGGDTFRHIYTYREKKKVNKLRIHVCSQECKCSHAAKGAAKYITVIQVVSLTLPYLI